MSRNPSPPVLAQNDNRRFAVTITRAVALSWLLALVATAAAVWGAPPASAHATIVSTTPGDGSHVDVSPEVLAFELSEPVTLVEGSAQLIDSTGDRHSVSTDRVEDGGRRIVFVVDGEIPDGAYLATARVISADTHVVSLSSRFTVGSVTQFGHVLDAGATTTGVEQYLRYPSKAAVYLGVVLSSGLIIAGRWVWPTALGGGRFRTVYRVGAAVLTVGLLGRFLVQVAQQSGGLVEASAAATVLGSQVGVAIAVAVVLNLACFAFPPGTNRTADALGYVQAASAVAAVTLGGHGGSTERWPLAFIGTATHVYAAALWLGGVCILALAIDGVAQLERWHRVAAGHVVLVSATGLTLAILQVRPIEALFRTSYGQVLIVKVVLVGLVVVAGYLTYRRYRHGTTDPAGDRGEVTRRSHIVTVEAGLAVAVLAATSVLSSLTPAKDSYTTNVHTELNFGTSEILDVEIDTVRRGPQTVTVRFPTPDTGFAAGAVLPDVDVELSSAQANVARMPIELTRTGPDDDGLTWISDGVIVPTAGKWKVTVRFEGAHGPKLASFDYDAL
ncbi:MULTISPECIES: copper resistance CopC/CopD family protein [Rhodococcus]|uniref:CopD family protein n=1 Tax=Rhodococcus pseudokoreensis TaxID=2811421 RepID=A0A974WE60_9NOCA|nr:MULTISPECIES: CopD family protein [Rhodococcus]MBV6756399.1 CopD family protein [Rhodococcus opacus]QSE94893.1 CopD family protein [Rhodococcus pseudokoreensis]